MKSFFAMAWAADSPEADQYAEALTDRLRSLGREAHPKASGAGFRLFTPPGSPSGGDIVSIVNEDGTSCGAVVGKIFEHQEGSAAAKSVHTLDAGTCAAMRSSKGATVLERFWGSYVALCKDNQSLSVIADPMASIPCFFTLRHDVLLVFSHLEQCRFLDVHDYTLNRNFIALLLRYDKVQTGETGLNEVSELLGGERLIFQDGRVYRERLWDPRRIAGSPLKITTPDAAGLLAQTTRSVVASWAARYDRIGLNLSGGLDSSIVASCLVACRTAGRVTATHQIMDSADQSELRFAKAAAEHCRLAFRQVVQSAPEFLPDVNGHPPSARPFRQYIARSGEAYAGPGCSTAATFTGQGGDHLFLVARMPLVFADHLRLNGIGRETLPALYDAAILSGKSVWQVLRESVPALLEKKRAGGLLKAIRDRQTPINAHVGCGGSLESLLPEWVTQPGGTPPAKFEQINMLAHLVHMRRPFSAPGEPDVVHPLISQPLIELCLRIPAYQLCAGGESRGLARRAFDGALPDIIRHRATKGSAARYYRNQSTAHRQQLAEALLDGELVRQDILDRRAVELFFARRDDERHDFGHMVLIYYVIEAWLRSWTRLLRAPRSVRG